VRRIELSFGQVTVTAALNDSNTADLVAGALPVESRAQRWGDEVYFGIPVETGEEDAQADVDFGIVAYWPPGKALCFFFGPTPASTDETPVAASPVNIFGRLTAIEPEKLKKIPIGENVKVLKADQH